MGPFGNQGFDCLTPANWVYWPKPSVKLQHQHLIKDTLLIWSGNSWKGGLWITSSLVSCFWKKPNPLEDVNHLGLFVLCVCHLLPVNETDWSQSLHLPHSGGLSWFGVGVGEPAAAFYLWWQQAVVFLLGQLPGSWIVPQSFKAKTALLMYKFIWLHHGQDLLSHSTPPPSCVCLCPCKGFGSQPKWNQWVARFREIKENNPPLQFDGQ